MKIDKQLIREGRYQEALGANYNPMPYSLVAVNGHPVLTIPEEENKFYSAQEARDYATEFNITGDWVVFNANADWL